MELDVSIANLRLPEPIQPRLTEDGISKQGCSQAHKLLQTDDQRGYNNMRLELVIKQQ